jgi:hypothetical protein
MNSRMAVRCRNGTSFRIMMGCLAGFSSSRACTQCTVYKNVPFRQFADPDPNPDPPDPQVFGPLGSGSFYHHAKLVRKT